MKKEKIKVLFLTNIPSPYRVDFFNELGKKCDLTVTFEGTSATDRSVKWKNTSFDYFTPVFLKGKRINSDSFFCPDVLRVIKKKWDRIIIGMYSTATSMMVIEYLKIHGIPFYIEADGGLIKNENWFIKHIKKHFISSATFWISSGNKTTEYLVHYGADKNRCYQYPFTSVKRQDLFDVFETDNSEMINLIATSEEHWFSARNQVREKAKEYLGFTGKKNILSIGQFIPRKGLDVLLRAVKDIPSDYDIYIVGGTSSDAYKGLIEDNDLKRVHFVDFMEKKELLNYYKAVDIFVLPTREDIWGLVINEAMSYGLPVITTKKCVAGLELIQDEINGHLINVDSTNDLIDAINKCQDSQRITYGKNNYAFSLKNTIEDMAEVHMRILEKNEE